MTVGRAKRAVILILAALSLATSFGAVASEAQARPPDDENGCYYLITGKWCPNG